MRKLSLRFLLVFCWIAGFWADGFALGPNKKQQVNWPWVYPAVWKAGISLQWQALAPSDSGLKAALMPGFQADLVLNKNFLVGFSLDYLNVNSGDSLSHGKIWKPGIPVAFMIPLDDIDIHHLLLQFSPALSIGSFTGGRKTSFGYSLGLQYEYTLFSNNILSPGIFYNHFSAGNLRSPSLGTWSLGFRYIFGK